MRKNRTARFIFNGALLAVMAVLGVTAYQVSNKQEHIQEVLPKILRNESGAPYVLLYGRAKDKADQIGVKKILISLADTKTQAIAFVVLLG